MCLASKNLRGLGEASVLCLGREGLCKAEKEAFTEHVEESSFTN